MFVCFIHMCLLDRVYVSYIHVVVRIIFTEVYVVYPFIFASPPVHYFCFPPPPTQFIYVPPLPI